MSVYKCKMCGGSLEITEGMTVCECEYCGSKQTVPNADDEKKMKMYERANKLRFNCDFDKAAGIYENIVNEFSDEAEAYWGLVLCTYGIEYVDDPASGKKIPTCHRSSFDSVMTDDNFEQVMENSDSIARNVYREEAKAIEELRKGILEVSGKEEPYDIFICYKETDENGDRTIDSVMAQDVYDVLTEKGYRVFFSRITLEDKLGMEYEPYIFAALNSAKVMLAFGTTYEFYHAVWVKNEWSRFLKLMGKDKEKYLIPCYKNIDAYDIPKEFQHLQAQDMGKVGAIQDLARGIEKLIGRKDVESLGGNLESRIISDESNKAKAALERGWMALEDEEWKKADGFFEETLTYNAKNAEAYLGKLMATLHVRQKTDLVNQEKSFSEDGNFKKVIRFADEKLKGELLGYINDVEERNNSSVYNKAVSLMEAEEYEKAIGQFEAVLDYKDAAKLLEKCKEQKSIVETKALLENAITEDEIKLAIEKIGEKQSIPEIKNLIEEAKSRNGRISEEWKRRVEEIKGLRQVEEDNLKREITNDAKQKREKAISEKEKNKELLKKTIRELKDKVVLRTGELEKIGFFNVGKKKELRTEIDKINQEIINNENDFDSIEKSYQSAITLIDSEEKTKKAELAKILEEKYVLPVNPIEERNSRINGSYVFQYCVYMDYLFYISNNKVMMKKARIVRGEGKSANKGTVDKAYLAMNRWSNVCAIELFGYECNGIIAIKTDGTIVDISLEDRNEDFYEWFDDEVYENMKKWKDIKKVIIDVGEVDYCFLGIDSKGVIQFAGDSAEKNYASQLRGVVDVAISEMSGWLGLKPDKTVIAVGNEDVAQCANSWKNIESIFSDTYGIGGVTDTGEVVYESKDYNGDYNGWKNVKKVAIDRESGVEVGLTRDGKLLCTDRCIYREYINSDTIQNISVDNILYQKDLSCNLLLFVDGRVRYYFSYRTPKPAFYEVNW